MAKKYIDAEKLKAEIDYRLHCNGAFDEVGDYQWHYDQGMVDAYKYIREVVTSLQQEQPIKVYRVENEKEQKGLWRKFDGTWEPLFDMLTDGQCKDMPMEDSPIYREGGKRWFASAPSKETLQKWFSRRDLEELTIAGFTITEFEVLEYRKLSDFEYIFTRESIVNKTNINVTDIYPKEQPDFPTTDEQMKEFLATHPKIKVPEKYKNPVKDLCTRLPYGVECQYERIMPIGYKLSDTRTIGRLNKIEIDTLGVPYFTVDGYLFQISDFKPYLRPMSSMTEEEKKEARNLIYATVEFTDWCNEHHLDYRRLIEKGLALEAPEGMYKTE